MAFDPVLVGTTANDGTGDPLRTAFTRVNSNFGLAVEGPATATSGRVAVYDGTSGKLLEDGTKLEADLVVGPASVTAGSVAAFNGTTGKLVQQGLGAGTATAPSLAFAADSNTGLFNPSADTLAFSTNGVERVRVASTGFVGINNNNPEAQLDVFGGSTQVGGEWNFRVRSSDMSTIPATMASGSSAGQLQIFAGALGSASYRGGQIDFIGGLASVNAGALRFRTGVGFGGTDQPIRLLISGGGIIFAGNGETAASPTNSTISATGGTGTDIGGATLTIRGGASTGSGAGGPIVFSTAAAGASGTAVRSATERMRVTSEGVVALPTGSPGIKFGTRNANLADYEEGTWTGATIGGTTAGTYNWSDTFFSYTKIGNLVTINFVFNNVSAIPAAGSGDLRISGLPFSKKANVNATGAVNIQNVAFAANTRYLVWTFDSTGATRNYLILVQVFDNGARSNVPVTALTTIEVFLSGTVSYFV